MRLMLESKLMILNAKQPTFCHSQECWHKYDCSGTWNKFRGELGFEFAALCGMAAKAGPLAQRILEGGAPLPPWIPARSAAIGKLACQRVWVRSASLACQA
jgi:hypothetical protein